MLRQLLGFTLLAFSSCTIIYSQKTPEPTKQPENPEKPAVFTFQFDGGSYLGIEAQEVTRENFARLGLREVRGVAVEKVVENSPAAQSGLQTGDVIVKFNGEEVESVRKLSRLIAEVAPDHRVELTILRNGSEQEITATMGKRDLPAVFGSAFKPENFPNMPVLPKMPDMLNLPDMKKMPRVQVFPPDAKTDSFVFKTDGDGAFFFGSNRQIGVSVSSLSKQLGEYFGVTEGRGLLVSSVRENGPAAKAGLRAGDIIVEADGKEVKTNMDLIRALNGKKEGSIELTIMRDRNRQSVQVTPEKLQSDAITPLFDETLPAAPEVRVVTPQIQVAPYTRVKPATPGAAVTPVLPKRVL